MTVRAGKLSKSEHGISNLPSAPTVPHYESNGAAKEDAEAFNAPMGQPETKQIAYSSSMPHVNCTGPCCRPDLWASGVKGVAAPAANALPELEIPKNLKDCHKSLMRWNGEDRAFTEVDRIFEISLIERVAKSEAEVTWQKEHCRITDCNWNERLAAAQQEIAARLIHEKSQFDEIKVLRKISDEATFELAALRQSHAVKDGEIAELKDELIEAIELAKLKEIPSRVTLSRWESAIAHAELLGGKK